MTDDKWLKAVWRVGVKDGCYSFTRLERERLIEILIETGIAWPFPSGYASRHIRDWLRAHRHTNRVMTVYLDMLHQIIQAAEANLVARVTQALEA